MDNAYNTVGEPSDVYIIFHNSDSKSPTYCFSSVPPSTSVLAGFGMAGMAGMGMSQMMAASTPDDLFHPAKSEPASEKDLSVSELLYQCVDKATIPSNHRCREAFGFNLVPNHKTARSLLDIYALVKTNGVPEDLLGIWRTMATMVKNVEKFIVSEEEKANFVLNVKPVLVLMDQDMKGCATRWAAFECKLRSRMIAQPVACIKCGSEEKALECSRCRGIRYCSKDCQVADWPVHKQACSQEEADRLSIQYEKAQQGESTDKDQGKVVLNFGSSLPDISNLNFEDSK